MEASGATRGPLRAALIVRCPAVTCRLRAIAHHPLTISTTALRQQSSRAVVRSCRRPLHSGRAAVVAAPAAVVTARALGPVYFGALHLMRQATQAAQDVHRSLPPSLFPRRKRRLDARRGW